MDLPIKLTEEGIFVYIRLTPKASRNTIGDVMIDANQQAWLKIYVTAVPEDGKANKALLRLLAKAWKIPMTSMEIISGHHDRQKTLKIHGVKTKDILSFLS